MEILAQDDASLAVSRSTWRHLFLSVQSGMTSKVGGRGLVLCCRCIILFSVWRLAYGLE